MRKIAKFVTAFALVALCALLLCLASAPMVGFAEAQAIAADETVSAFVEQLCEYNANGDKSGAIELIVDSFEAVSGKTAEVLQFSRDKKSYFNIQVTLEASAKTDKQIIIGAHYDAVGAGAGDNACGVAVLYQTLKTLSESKKSLPYNVVFVAFDGEEDGLLGSNHYVNGYESISHDGMSEEVVANTLVMFNIDSIARGKNLYLMCENKRTDLANLILSKSNGLIEKPYARGTYLELDVSRGYGYYEYVQNSDHTPFRLAGIPIAFFFSGSYSFGSWDFDAGEAINSSSDKFENLPVNFTNRIQTVSEAIVNTVLSSEFVDVAANARSQLVNLDLTYNFWWPTIVVGVILVALVVLTILYSRKLQKKAILGTAEIKSQKVFDKPSAEDIFSFKDDDGKHTDGDIDDIFTLKK